MAFQPKTKAEALAAAQAVNEARVTLLLSTRQGGGAESALWNLELSYWRAANEFNEVPARKRGKR